MSILGNITNTRNMGTPFFNEFKKQASFFLKEKIRTARLALTDVTPAELLTEEAINGNPWAPDSRTMGLISRAAFEVDDYWRIVEILHKRLMSFDRKNWRVSYNALILLEHLLTHGPESVAEEFQSDIDVIQEMGIFHFIDERGFNWGLNVRKKSERILKLLEKGSLLKEERVRARKLTCGIKGFGSFSRQSSAADGSHEGSLVEVFQRCNTNYVNHGDRDNQIFFEETANRRPFNNEKSEIRKSSKENRIPKKELLLTEAHEKDKKKELKPLLGCQKGEAKTELFIEEDHPFNNLKNQSTESLLCARRDGISQGC